MSLKQDLRLAVSMRKKGDTSGLEMPISGVPLVLK